MSGLAGGREFLKGFVFFARILACIRVDVIICLLHFRSAIRVGLH